MFVVYVDIVSLYYKYIRYGTVNASGRKYYAIYLAIG